MKIIKLSVIYWCTTLITTPTGAISFDEQSPEVRQKTARQVIINTHHEIEKENHLITLKKQEIAKKRSPSTSQYLNRQSSDQYNRPSSHNTNHKPCQCQDSVSIIRHDIESKKPLSQKTCPRYLMKYKQILTIEALLSKNRHAKKNFFEKHKPKPCDCNQPANLMLMNSFRRSKTLQDPCPRHLIKKKQIAAGKKILHQILQASIRRQ